MSDRQEQIDREARAARLLEARKKTGIGGVRKVCARFGWNENTYKAHESGRNGFGTADARVYAKAFGVSYQWLYLGIGHPGDNDTAEPTVAVDVPLISWVSAGALGEQASVTSLSDFPTVSVLDLPDGDWIALRVEGDSMNKISPPGSIIFVNRRDRRLVPNGCYVVADEHGRATYKRYRPDDQPPFQPASYKEIPAPDFDGAVTVIGRVRRSIIDF
ncbi:LexA family transcriptional regulator [Rhizobium cremeum]|uniref:LexA family protein n=1 Tax=Rhizobium cremeum TaxID=2813827 RepID=UPI001FCFAF43|nr:S24 family peptidase [Rhizobium cremeum]MCJ7996662.1 LexA family transcriptional regulator [Rhizobium cremeum]MCJ7999386.1 LexA family transcriptional regulator [Rhizobium cremeum]